MSINYKEEVQKLQESENRDWFKPTTGSYKLTIKEEPEEIEKVFDPEKPQEITKQVRLNLDVGGENKTWDVGKGQTWNSVWGQLAVLGEKFGTLKGQTVTLNVTRAKGKNQYQVTEALDIIKALQEKKEEEA